MIDLVKQNKLMLFLIGLLVVSFFMIGVVSAENNTTIEDVPYLESEQYQQDLQYWYDHYTNDRATGYESILRAELEDLLNSGTLSDEERNDAILIKLGWDFRLDNFMDPEKRTIDEETGAVEYSLGIGNWWANRFGNGIFAADLPQTQAEGDALYKIYCENYAEWISVLKGETE